MQGVSADEELLPDQSGWGSPRSRKMRWFGSFTFKIAIAAATIIAGDIIFWQRTMLGSGFGLFALVLLAGVLIARSGIVKHIGAWMIAAAGAYYAFALFDDPSLLSLALFLVALSVLTLLPAATKGGDGWQWLQRLIAYGLMATLIPFLDFIKVMKVRFRRRKRTGQRSVLSIFATLFLPVSGSIVFIMLFAAANPILESWLAGFTFPDLDGLFIVRMFLWTAILWLGWGLLRPRSLKHVAGTFEGRGDAKIPGVTVQSLKLSLIVFNLIFAAQNMMDVAYFGGFATLPADITLAEYAHRGAYPLIATAILAGLFTLVTLRPGSTTARDPLIRPLLVLWIAQNIFLVGSSIERTLDYVRIYSLTQWRIAALAWMVLVAVGLALICWRMLKDKNASWLINSNVIAAGIVLSIFAVVDTGAIAAGWNVRHTREVGGEGAKLDLCYLNNLGGSALLPLVELEKRADIEPAFRKRVSVVRNVVQSEVAHAQANDFWTWRNARRLSDAEQIAGKVKASNTYDSNYRCDGSQNYREEDAASAVAESAISDPVVAQEDQTAGQEAAEYPLPSSPPPVTEQLRKESDQTTKDLRQESLTGAPKQ